MEKEILLQVPAVISKITTMGSGSIRLQVDTQEDVSPVAQVKIFTYYNKLGVFAFSKSNIDKDELIIPDYNPVEKESKTPSQRQRNVIYLLWKQGGKRDLYGQECDSDTYYKQYMDKIINHLKEKLD